MNRVLLLLLAAYAALVAPRVWGFEAVWDARPLLRDAALAPAGPALLRAWTEDFWALAPPGDRFASGMVRPLVTTTYIAERALGLGAGGSHLVNLALHLGVAALVARLAAGLGGSGLVAGALVLLHPHAAGLVGDIASRTDLLAAACVVGSLLTRERPWGPLLLLLGAWSKELAYAGLGLWVLLDLWQGQVAPRRWLGGALVLGVAAAHRLWVVGPVAPDAEASAARALGSTGWALIHLVAPTEGGPWPAPRPPGAGWAALAGAALLAVKVPALRLGLGWVALAWAPMAGWLPIGVRESRELLYLPLVGLALAASLLVRSPRLAPPWGPRLALGAVLLLTPVHLARLEGWRGELSLWRWGTQTHPTSPLCWTNLGRAWAERGDLDQAEPAYLRAAQLAQQQRDATFFVKAATSLGRIALTRGQPERARVFLEDAARVAGPGGAPEAEALLAGLAGPP